MTGYSVYLPEKKDMSGLERVDHLVFVKEGFAWFAVISPLLWSVYYRLWSVALAIFGIMLLVNGAGYLLGLSPLQQFVFVLILNVVFAIEATGIRKWVLEKQKDYHFEGFVTGQDETDCQRRFLQDWFASSKEKSSS